MEVGGSTMTVADPSGGTCDAAGDFDRLLPLDAEDYPVLSRIDPHGDVELGTSAVRAALPEIDRLLAAARDGIERRGVLRLHALATQGSRIPASRLTFIGD